jgi:hypothetical protein
MSVQASLKRQEGREGATRLSRQGYQVILAHLGKRKKTMRKIIEYTLVSIDGVFADPRVLEFMDYRDDAYIRDGLGLLLACDVMLMGRNTYEAFGKIWPGRSHPWADRLNGMQKYVFSSKLDKAEWNNSTIIRGGCCC